jgi:hypothetical protein
MSLDQVYTDAEIVDYQTKAAPYPIPPGRGRWRVTLHRRVFSTQPTTPAATGLGELVDARGRSLQTSWCASAQFQFTLDGHSPSAAAIRELQHDVIAWRWDELSGRDIPMFRGPITQSEDQVTEQSHIVNYTCHDYFAMLARRQLTLPTLVTYTQQDQDTIASNLLNLGLFAQSSTGTSFQPGSLLPLQLVRVNPDGSSRGLSGQLRDRSYTGGSIISDLFDNLAHVDGGFEYDVLPRSDLNGIDWLRVFYPSQGVSRSDVVLQYGATVASFTRTVNSSDYGNYWRVIGNNNSSDQNAAQLYANVWNADANNVGAFPVGLWMSQDNASDVILQSTLNERAQGNLNAFGILMPSYSLVLRPGSYTWGHPNMGDTVPLLIQSGRLNVNDNARILGITYNIGDDGDEDVGLTVGRAPVTLAKILTDAHKDINALARR